MVGLPAAGRFVEMLKPAVSANVAALGVGRMAHPGPDGYALSFTGSVFSWLRKADSTNFGLPAISMSG